MSGQPSRNAKERLRLFLSECGRRAQVLRDSLRRQPNRIDPSSRFVSGFRYGYWEREARGLELLKEWLSPEQFAQYAAKSYFEVTGCHSGKRYRISHGTSMNIHELDGSGRPRVGWCFAPKGYLVAGDVMLAQKIALETDERSALAMANRFFVPEVVIDFIAPDGRPRHRSATVAAFLLGLTDPPPRIWFGAWSNFGQKGPPRLAAFYLDV